MARVLPLGLIAILLLLAILGRSLDWTGAAYRDAPSLTIPAYGKTQIVELDLAGVPATEMRRDATPVYDPRIVRRTLDEPGRIAGLVEGGRDGATPLANASVEVWCERASGRVLRRTRTDAAGRFVADELEPDVWFVEIEADGHGNVRQVVLLQRENTGVELEFMLPVWRELSVQLVGPAGPIADLESIGLDESLRDTLSMRVGRPGAEGLRTLDASPPRGPNRPRSESVPWTLGQFQVAAYFRADDVLHLLVGLRVAASCELPDRDGLVEFPIGAAQVRAIADPIDAYVVDADGDRPMPGVRVEIAYGEHVVRTLATDAAGRMQWHEAPPLAFTLTARADGYAEVSQSAHAPSRAPVGLRMQRGRRLAGTLVPYLDGERVGLWKLPGDDRRLGAPRQSVATAAGGFDFGHVEPGTYVLAVPTWEVQNLLGAEVPASRAATIVRIEGRDVLDAVVTWVAQAPPANAFRGRKVGSSLRKPR